MKSKIFLFIFCATGPLFLYAQNGTHLGLKGLAGVTYLYNENTFNGKTVRSDVTLGNFMGITVGQQYRERTGIMADVMYTSHNQNYANNKPGINENWSKKIKYVESGIYIRKSSSEKRNFASIFFIDLGPKFSYLVHATDTWTDTNSVSTSSISTNSYNKFNISFTTYVGSNWYLSDKLRLTSGVNVSYGFLDITKEGSSNNLDRFNNPYKPTNSFSMGISLGLIYVIETKRVYYSYTDNH
ncbi:MAG: hypothetical protein JKY33_02290 [Bacteroidia bacterium]|nr:hypothetical protein [Bacteroidia bacterium]